MMSARRGKLLFALWLIAAFLIGAGAYAQTAQPRPTPPQPDTQPFASDSLLIDSAGVPLVSPGQAPVADAPDIAPDAPQQITAGEALAQAKRDVDTPLGARLVSLLGIAALLGLGWLMSANRRRVDWRLVGIGTALQFVFALIILKTPLGEAVFAAINDAVVALLGFTVEGARFLFGNLVFNNIPVGTGAPGMGPVAGEGMAAVSGAFFAFNVLPTIIFFSALMTVAYHIGIMQSIVRGMAWVMQRTLRTSGAETLSASGNIFLGQTEAPLLIKPFVDRMTKSELHAVMTGGFATVAGGVMAAYVGMLLAYFPTIAGHLMAASVMSAPAALVFSKLMYPETEVPETGSDVNVKIEKIDANVIDAAARGAGEGLTLALNVAAMLLAFIAIVALFNALLAWVGDVTTITAGLRSMGALAADQRLTLEILLGWLLAPLAWVMGVPWNESVQVGSLLGVKTVLNEFVAYLQLANGLTAGTPLSPRSVIIATYALCGFANLSSIGIQIGGIGGIAPRRRSDLAQLGMRAMIAGTLASFQTAAIAGILI